MITNVSYYKIKLGIKLTLFLIPLLESLPNLKVNFMASR